MDDDNFIIRREDVYVGNLLEAFKIKACLKDNLYNKRGEYKVCHYHPYRAIIFEIKNDKAIDLLYGDEYPILGRGIDRNNNMILVDKFVNLNVFLRKVGYNEFLSYSDIEDICDNVLSVDVIRANKDIIKGKGIYDYFCMLDEYNKFKILLSKIIKLKDLIDVRDYNKLLYIVNSTCVRSYKERDMNPFLLTKKEEEKIKSLNME